jgi:hypothetical protein
VREKLLKKKENRDISDGIVLKNLFFSVVPFPSSNVTIDVVRSTDALLSSSYYYIY